MIEQKPLDISGYEWGGPKRQEDGSVLLDDLIAGLVEMRDYLGFNVKVTLEVANQPAGVSWQDTKINSGDPVCFAPTQYPDGRRELQIQSRPIY